MADAGAVLYVDTSALIKLLVREAESDAVGAQLSRWPARVTSSLTGVELSRAYGRAVAHGREGTSNSLTPHELIGALATVPMTPRVLRVASSLAPPTLRTLDAIHLASALAFGADLGGMLTYDNRLAEAAEDAGVPVLS